MDVPQGPLSAPAAIMFLEMLKDIRQPGKQSMLRILVPRVFESCGNQTLPCRLIQRPGIIVDEGVVVVEQHRLIGTDVELVMDEPERV